MKTKEGVHPRIVALGLPSPPPWAQKPLQNKRRRGRGVGGSETSLRLQTPDKDTVIEFLDLIRRGLFAKRGQGRSLIRKKVEVIG
jgi:hypothetical protein